MIPNRTDYFSHAVASALQCGNPRVGDSMLDGVERVPNELRAAAVPSGSRSWRAKSTFQSMRWGESATTATVAACFVIPAKALVIPAKAFVIPAKAGIRVNGTGAPGSATVTACFRHPPDS